MKKILLTLTAILTLFTGTAFAASNDNWNNNTGTYNSERFSGPPGRHFNNSVEPGFSFNLDLGNIFGQRKFYNGRFDSVCLLGEANNPRVMNDRQYNRYCGPQRSAIYAYIRSHCNNDRFRNDISLAINWNRLQGMTIRQANRFSGPQLIGRVLHPSC